MNKKIQAWIEAEAAVAEVKHIATIAYCNAGGVVPPKNLRPAEPSDIVEGAIIWYLDHDPECKKWSYVEEVLNPSDQFKAFCAEDGCRYGLYGAHVEDL